MAISGQLIEIFSRIPPEWGLKFEELAPAIEAGGGPKFFEALLNNAEGSYEVLQKNVLAARPKTAQQPSTLTEIFSPEKVVQAKIEMKSKEESELDKLFGEQRSQFLKQLEPEEAGARQRTIEALLARGLLSSPLQAEAISKTEGAIGSAKAGILGELARQRAGQKFESQQARESFERQKALLREQQAEERQAARRERKRRKRGGIARAIGGGLGSALGFAVPAVGPIFGTYLGSQLGGGFSGE